MFVDMARTLDRVGARGILGKPTRVVAFRSLSIRFRDLAEVESPFARREGATRQANVLSNFARTKMKYPRSPSSRHNPPRDLSPPFVVASFPIHHPMGDEAPVGLITERAYARIGLFGNPSDGYFGKTISVSIQNFFSEVVLVPDQQCFSSRISFEPGPYDWNAFESLSTLARHTKEHGHYGGVRLLRALCVNFHTYCESRNLNLHEQGFTLRYSTNIPKQTGLSGSSSIIVAGLRCLMKHYDINIPLQEQPQLVLKCETDLGINAGLQDRVIQVYEGAVAMDFSDEETVTKTGAGKYEPLPVYKIPELMLVWGDKGNDSSITHADVKKRWEAGDEFIRSTMRKVAAVAEKAKSVLLSETATQTECVETLASLMNENFDLRREMFGDAALGQRNIEMIETPRLYGAASKFTGSGGAVVVLCPDGDEQLQKVKTMCEQKGFKTQMVVLNPATSAA